jgi:proteic killer suppression protein
LRILVNNIVNPQNLSLGFLLPNTLCINNDMRYCFFMIKSFKCKETQKIFNRSFSKKLPQNIHLKSRQKLVLIDAATEVIDLKIPPGNRLEELKDDRIGQHSIRINDQWRICFIWKSGDAFNVEIVDYH